MSIEAAIAKRLMDIQSVHGFRYACRVCHHWHAWYRTEEAKAVVRAAARLAFGRS
jgi:hypothetical protein